MCEWLSARKRHGSFDPEILVLPSHEQYWTWDVFKTESYCELEPLSRYMCSAMSSKFWEVQKNSLNIGKLAKLNGLVVLICVESLNTTQYLNTIKCIRFVDTEVSIKNDNPILICMYKLIIISIKQVSC